VLGSAPSRPGDPDTAPAKTHGERLERLRRAILRGDYEVDPRLLAERLIASGVLRRAAKA
jgi:anti-sigma28 factor (negative regulator of flagellin synthesis)